MDDDADARRGNGSAIEIEVAMKLRPSRQAGVDAGPAQEIEREFSLGEQAVPEMHREVLVRAAEAGDEVVLEGADGTFGGIAAMDMGRDQLKVNLLGSKEVLENCGGFVVETLEARF